MKNRVIKIKSENPYKIKVWSNDFNLNHPSLATVQSTRYYSNRVDFEINHDPFYIKLASKVDNPGYELDIGKYHYYGDCYIQDLYVIHVKEGRNTWLKVDRTQLYKEIKISVITSNHEIMELESLCLR